MSVIREKTFSFAIQVVGVYKTIVAKHKEYVLSKQFLKSGTAPGALAREAQYAQSRADFISKLSIALKEANECNYWASLLHAGGFITQETFRKIDSDNKEIIFLLISSINTAKSRKDQQ